MAGLFLLKARFRAVCCFIGSVRFALQGLAIASHRIFSDRKDTFVFLLY
jgi:hypothetical protein